MLKKILIISLVVILSASCRPTRQIERAVSDSVIIQRVTEYRDTTIQVPADSSWLQALIECDSNGQAYIRQIQSYKAGDQALMPIVRIVDNTLQVDCICDSVAIYQKFYRIHDTNTRVSKSSETVTLVVNRLTWLQKAQIYAFWIMALIFIAKLIIKRFLI